MRTLRPIRLALAAAALLAFAPAPRAAFAQDAAPTSATADSATGAPLVAAPAPSTASSGLPVQSGPPRTLRAYWHVYAAFTIAWLLVFGYAISLGRRFGRLEREIGSGTAS
jgi:CcmD family protein